MKSLKILTISGWTQPADALQALAPQACMLDYIEQVPETLDHRGQYDAVIGWSLGGVIARRLLACGAITARALISIAAPYQFVRSDRVSAAMGRETFEQFYSNFENDTARTASRFHGLLLKGDVRAAHIRPHLSHHPRINEAHHWLRWLDFLRSYSAADHNYSALPKTLIIHGSGDAIIPAAQAELLARTLSSAQTMMLPGAGHAPHLHDAAGLKSAITDFIA